MRNIRSLFFYIISRWEQELLRISSYARYFSKEFSITFAYSILPRISISRRFRVPEPRKVESLRVRLKYATPCANEYRRKGDRMYICSAREALSRASMFNAAASHVIGSDRLKRTIAMSRFVCSSGRRELNSRR